MTAYLPFIFGLGVRSTKNEAGRTVEYNFDVGKNYAIYPTFGYGPWVRRDATGFERREVAGGQSQQHAQDRWAERQHDRVTLDAAARQGAQAAHKLLPIEISVCATPNLASRCCTM